MTALHGLRAARWLRESTEGQMDNFGPAAQRFEQDERIAEHGLIDTGIGWVVAHSGGTVGQTPAFRDMLSSAGTTWDVLLVAESSRLAREVETAHMAARLIHEAGAAILFCREGWLSTDDQTWDTWARQTVEDAAYRRRLSRNSSGGYRAKWLTTGVPGGRPPLGYVRTNAGRHWAIDQGGADTVRAIFAGYASGECSQADLADKHGLTEDRIEEMLKNDAYIGVSRYKGKPHPKPAPWKPIIDSATFERTQAVRAEKGRGGGAHRADRPDMLANLLHHECGRYIRRDGTAARRNGSRYAQRLHPDLDKCTTWGDAARRADHFFTEPLKGLIRDLTISDESLVRVAEVVRPERDDLEPRRMARERKRLADEWTAGRITVEELARREAELKQQEPAPEQPTVTPEEAADWLRQLRTSLALIESVTPNAAAEAWSALTHGIFEKVTAQDDGRLGLRLSQAAWDHGLAPYLIEAAGRCEWRARPDSNRRSPA
jgi:DNA invertase Pin-like site-specific DNA recombinase